MGKDCSYKLLVLLIPFQLPSLKTKTKKPSVIVLFLVSALIKKSHHSAKWKAVKKVWILSSWVFWITNSALQYGIVVLISSKLFISVDHSILISFSSLNFVERPKVTILANHSWKLKKYIDLKLASSAQIFVKWEKDNCAVLLFFVDGATVSLALTKKDTHRFFSKRGKRDFLPLSICTVHMD